MPPTFLSDYGFYNSGNESPPVFHLWSALVALAVVSGRRTHFLLGQEEGYEQLRICPDLYVCFVAPQGVRKSFAKDVARDLVAGEFPDFPMSYNVETREGIWKYLASEESIRVFTNEKGELVEYHPMFLGINELKNFLSVNPYGMVDFLIDIFGRTEFKNRTKHEGIDIIPNPNINILACATTEYTIGQLKDGLLGGLARRMLFVSVNEYVRNPRPAIPSGGREAWNRVRSHLHKVNATVGTFRWRSEEDQLFYDRWYVGLKSPPDPLMSGFYNSKHIQVLKVAMLMALAEYDIKLLLTRELLEQAISMVDLIEPGMIALFASSGRNELIGPMNRIIEAVEGHGGVLPERLLRGVMDRDLNPQEQYSMIRHLETTKRIKMVNMGGDVGMVAMAWRLLKKEK